MRSDTWKDSHTPALVALDARGLAVRDVAYCRQSGDQHAESRITRHIFNGPGQRVASWDPRLWGQSPRPNVATVHSLSDHALQVDSADAGWHLELLNEAHSRLWRRDARGTERQTEYDAMQRPVAIGEHLTGEPSGTVECITYGDASAAFAVHNQCGRWIRHDDTAGSLLCEQYSLSGLSLIERRRFLNCVQSPNWPLDTTLRDALLEEAPGFVTRQNHGPCGELQSQTDAGDNRRTFAHTREGQLKEVRLQLHGVGQDARLLVSAIEYDAAGRVISETAGNGVVTTLQYGADDGRPIQVKSSVAGSVILQDLHYRHDPVGNICRLEDHAQPVRYFRNQRVDPANLYGYDSLYQLVEAQGRQVMSPSYGPALPERLPVPLDPNQLSNYTQSFVYDASGNLLSRHHSGAATLRPLTSRYSNRSLVLYDEEQLSDEEHIAKGFDTAGNQLNLLPGQVMSWDARHQLQRVTMVKREDGPDDDERYVYDHRAVRLRKVRLTHGGGRTLRAEVRYLQGVEIHFDNISGESYRVITVDTGRSQVLVLQTSEFNQRDQVRFSLTDLLGSCTSQIDEQSRVINQEGYYPFGGTAWWAGNSALESTYKSRRYCRKIRDATGLYYYGHRYYAPWLQRWMTPDPAGDVDGLNRYLMVRNNPVNFFDVDGLGRRAINGETTFSAGQMGSSAERKTYFDPGLQKRLDTDIEGSRQRYQYVAEQLIHQRVSTYEIKSSFISDTFDNIYLPHHWIFLNNFRDVSTKDYYASDVTRFQYTTIAQANKFDGVLPSKITRGGIVNKQTIKLTKKLESGSPKLFEVFFKQTENGKSTRRILDEFGLQATHVERITYKKHIDFLIHVRPVEPNADQATLSTTLVPEHAPVRRSPAVGQLAAGSSASRHPSRGFFSSIRKALS